MRQCGCNLARSPSVVAGQKRSRYTRVSEQGDMADQWCWYTRAIHWMMKMREDGSTTSAVGELIARH